MCSVAMPSACAPFGSSVDKHMIAVRAAFAWIGIHIPKIADDEKATASLTDEAYHTAIFDRKDPQANSGAG